ncbi:MAG: DUF4386 domain-containing protein [Zymomonas sp.]|nr:MAG: DUF4386 domain-containing protein [Zymomonas sp.]
MGMSRYLRSTPVVAARLAGVFYLVVIVTAPIAMSVRNRLIVSGDTAASAISLLAHEPLYRLTATADTISSICYIVVAALFYVLFEPVSRTLSLIATFFSLIGIAVSTVGVIFDVAALTILHTPPHPGSLTVQQLNELALLVVRFGEQAANVGIVFFGCYCLAVGWLLVKSRFLPRILGAGMIVAGLGWLSFIYQPLAAALSPFNMISGLGEIALTAWLLIVGLDAAQWTEQADAHDDNVPLNRFERERS